jgi:N-acetylmuramoyl-L-alanine amidase
MSKKQEMIQFFIDKANSGDGVDNDGAYGFQCADVPCYGLRHWYGVTLWGNAYDLLESARSQGLKVVYDADYPKAGWFFVKSYVAGDGVNYGHTGLVYEDSDGETIKTIEQNIDGNWDYLEVGGPCRYNERSVSEIVGYIVPPEEVETGWQKNDTGYWYVHSDGSYPKDKFEKIDGTWYYFDESGYMLADRWKKHSDGNWYYFDQSGEMATGWKKIAEKWYYFDVEGAMKTGWVKYKDTWYYLDSKDGNMVSNEFVRAGQGWYYIKADGTMADKPEFTVEPDGLITTK